MTSSTAKNGTNQNGDFTTRLNQMRKHYKAGLSQLDHPDVTSPWMTVPSFLDPDAPRSRTNSRHINRPMLEQLPSEVTAAVEVFQGQTNQFTGGEQEALTSITDGYINKGQSYNTFRERLAKRKAEAKAKAMKQIDNYFDKIEEVSRDLPEQEQHMLLHISDGIMDFFHNEILGSITDFAASLARNIFKWVRKALDYIQDIFSGLGSTISGFFGA